MDDFGLLKTCRIIISSCFYESHRRPFFTSAGFAAYLGPFLAFVLLFISLSCLLLASLFSLLEYNDTFCFYCHILFLVLMGISSLSTFIY